MAWGGGSSSMAWGGGSSIRVREEEHCEIFGRVLRRVGRLWEEGPQGGAVGQGDETAQKGRISMARSVHSNWQQKEAAIQAARVTQLFAERNEFAERNQDLQDELAKLRAETTAQLQAVQKQNEELRANHEKLMQRIPLWKQQELFPEDDPNIELLHDLDAAPYATD
ncbi:hypothetical protein CYMTET_16705 [Cymbomonas tetramitiformis]|uniref:Uncharacterized protein n=1 Tax=Cymbomonas tetramitiformis TaxID=36881 RepID=A0AAE0L7V8_9CHLO|nr:hypothetical protein CYMTET_16705 [Cymbomonas tetramitiformis]